MATKMPQQSHTTIGAPSEAGAEQAFVAERNIAAIRLAVIGYNSLVYNSVMGHAGTTPWLSYLLIITSAIYGAMIFFLHPYRRYPVMLSSYFTSASDAIFITFWLYATAGFESPFYLLLYISIVAVAFRCQEALNNVAQHAQARSVLVRFTFDTEQVVLQIEDDGAGFVVPARLRELARRGCLGI
jgi:hypothetical protein